jgi:excisionase family DNA binding protein
MQSHAIRNSRDAPQAARPLAVSVKTVCELVGVGITTMSALIKAGRVKTVSIGRRRLVIFLESLLVANVAVRS